MTHQQQLPPVVLKRGALNAFVLAKDAEFINTRQYEKESKRENNK